jgi:hypothetical protein
MDEIPSSYAVVLAPMHTGYDGDTIRAFHCTNSASEWIGPEAMQDQSLLVQRCASALGAIATRKVDTREHTPRVKIENTDSNEPAIAKVIALGPALLAFD